MGDRGKVRGRGREEIIEGQFCKKCVRRVWSKRGGEEVR